ncbi:MAG TPA: hypothetical protein VH419_12970 [Nocardioidaceae bacterium]
MSGPPFHPPSGPSRSTSAGQPDEQRRQPTPWTPPNASSTPNAERYLLEADALRRRQLRSALLHGSSRTWRDQGRIWPGVIAGIVVVTVILASFAVMKAFEKSEELQKEQESPTAPAATSPATPTQSTR